MTWMTQRRDSEQELVACDTLGRLLHFDIDVREPVEAVQDPSQAPLRCCAVSPSGRYLAFAGDDQLVKVLELATGAVCALGQGHSGAVKTLAWTLDERQLITGGDDMCLCVWNFYLGGAPSTNEGGGGAAVNSNTSYLGRK
jgi:WD40 repeat protein